MARIQRCHWCGEPVHHPCPICGHQVCTDHKCGKGVMNCYTVLDKELTTLKLYQRRMEKKWGSIIAKLA